MTQDLNEDLQTPPMTRKVRLGDIDSATDKTIEISEEERETIMALLDLKDLGGLSFVYRVRQGTRKKVLLTGRLQADVVQTCVVTLEPVPDRIDVPVEAEFLPIEKIAALQKRAENPSQAGEIDWPEAIEGDEIDLGPLVYETLATSLDPYPKKKTGANFQWTDGEQSGETPKNNPFSVLKGLKNS